MCFKPAHLSLPAGFVLILARVAAWPLPSPCRAPQDAEPRAGAKCLGLEAADASWQGCIPGDAQAQLLRPFEESSGAGSSQP